MSASVMPNMDASWGWETLAMDGRYHVVPTCDDKEHFSLNCSCYPNIDEELSIVTHKSFDGREDFENGKRKPS